MKLPKYGEIFSFSAIILIILILYLYKDTKAFYQHPVNCMKTNYHQRPNNENTKTVLFYSRYFGENVWGKSGVGYSWNLTREDGKSCVHNCKITYDKCHIQHSDAVIFHEADLPSPNFLRSLDIYRNPKQRWVYYTHENPHNTNNNPSNYNGIFNWTITYAKDSDVFYPYWYYRKIQSNEIPINHGTTNYATGKDKLIVWAASHCGLLRDQVVRKLLKFLPVTIIGRCSKLFKQNSPAICKKKSPSCPPFLKRFKFYLAFENALCTDYVTEKYWETPINNNMVPIVLGSNYDAKVAIPGSYINIMDYKSIGDLVKHIKYLDRNDTAYNEYFQWKTKFTTTYPGERSWTCQLCANLYNKSLPRKVYNNLGEYWGVKANCKNPQLMKKISSIINSESNTLFPRCSLMLFSIVTWRIILWFR